MSFWKLSLFIFVLFFSCQHRDEKFIKEKWSAGDTGEGYFPQREYMVSDLMKNHLKKGMTFREVINLLGEVGTYHGAEFGEVGYYIEQKYTWNDIDPVGAMNFVLTFDKDSTLIDFGLSEWEK